MRTLWTRHILPLAAAAGVAAALVAAPAHAEPNRPECICLLYTSDAADE